MILIVVRSDSPPRALWRSLLRVTRLEFDRLGRDGVRRRRHGQSEQRGERSEGLARAGHPYCAGAYLFGFAAVVAGRRQRGGKRRRRRRLASLNGDAGSSSPVACCSGVSAGSTSTISASGERSSSAAASVRPKRPTPSTLPEVVLRLGPPRAPAPRSRPRCRVARRRVPRSRSARPVWPPARGRSWSCRRGRRRGVPCRRTSPGTSHDRSCAAARPAWTRGRCSTAIPMLAVTEASWPSSAKVGRSDSAIRSATRIA